MIQPVQPNLKTKILNNISFIVSNTSLLKFPSIFLNLLSLTVGNDKQKREADSVA